MYNNWIVIGLGGATCSGKTTLANELHKKLPQSVLIQQDDYFYPVGSPNLEYIDEVKHYNWDVLSAIDVDRLVNDCKNIISDTSPSPTDRVLIIEGNFIFMIEQLCHLIHRKYFMTTSKEVSRYRRQTRRYKHYDEKYFDNYCWPAYERHREELISKCHLNEYHIIDGNLPTESHLSIILHSIHKDNESHNTSSKIDL